MAEENVNIKVQIDGIDQAVSQVNKLKSSLKDAGNVGDPFQKYGESTKGFTKNLGDVGGAMGLLPARFQGVIGSVQAFSKALLASPLGWIFLAITAVVGALTLLGKAFISTDSGGLKFAIVMKQISQVLDVVMNRLAEFAKGLSNFLSGNFTQGIKDMGAAFNGLSTEISAAAEAGKQYAIALDEIEDRQTRFISQEAELQGQMAQLNYIAADQTKSGKERMNALLEVQKIEKQIAQERIDVAKKQFDADLALASNGNEVKKRLMLDLINANEVTHSELMKKPLYANLWDSKEFQENYKKLEEGRAKVVGAQNEVAETGRRTQMRITGFMKQAASDQKAINDERKKKEEERIKQIEAQAEAEWKASEKGRLLFSPEAERKRYEVRRDAGLLSQQEILNNEESFYRQQLIEQGFSGDELNKLVEKQYQTRLEISGKYGKQINEELESFQPDIIDNGTPLVIPVELELTPEQQQKLLDDLGNLATMVEGLSQSMFGNIQTAADNFYITLQDKNATWHDQLKSGLEVLSQVSNTIFAEINKSREKQLQKDLDAVAKQFESQYTDLERLKDKKLISDKEYAKRKEKLDKEQAAKELALKKDAAQKEKTAAIIQAIINTALAVTAALATPVIGIAMAIIAGVLGAAQVAYIASQPLAYKKGGMIPKYATGGLLMGDSHENGGIPITAEGGEYIINKTTTQKPGMLNYLNGINNNTIQPQQASVSVINREDLRSIVETVVGIPVINVESDSTRVQRKVASIESKSSW